MFVDAAAERAGSPPSVRRRPRREALSTAHLGHAEVSAGFAVADKTIRPRLAPVATSRGGRVGLAAAAHGSTAVLRSVEVLAG